jgi:hypothetical protein
MQTQIPVNQMGSWISSGKEVPPTWSGDRKPPHRDLRSLRSREATSRLEATLSLLDPNTTNYREYLRYSYQKSRSGFA